MTITRLRRGRYQAFCTRHHKGARGPWGAVFEWAIAHAVEWQDPALN